MTYCPKCGTANRDGSRFCNECGEELRAQTQVACSRCGTLNPIQNVLCSECSARLPSPVSSAPDAGVTPTIKGLSLPTKNPVGEQDEGADAAAAPEPEDGIPAWLRELGASLSEEGGPDEPDSPEDTGEVPAWLRDLRASLPETPDDEMEPAQEEVQLPDWLAAAEPTSAEAQPGSAFRGHEPESDEHELEPAFDSEISEPEPRLELQAPHPETRATEIDAEDEPPLPASAEEEVPGWLSRLVPGAAATRPESEPPSAEKEETPAWLTRLVPEASAAEDESEEEEALDRQGELETLPYDADAQPEPAPVETEETEIPDWMADLQAAGEEADAETVASDHEIEEDEIPDWLADFQPVEEESDAEAEPAQPGAEIEEGEIPDWLAELRPVDEEVHAEEPLPDIEIEEGEIPDWVAQLRPVDEEATVELEKSAIEIEGEVFPDRVTELEPPSDELPFAETLEGLDESEIEPLEEEPTFKLPDEVEAILGPAVPAWLAELQVEAPEAAAAIIEETLVDGELPDWLVRSEFEPDETLTPAEIPAWLLALKPPELRAEGEEVEISFPEVKELSEETGILAGIQGTLPVEMLIAQPRAIAAVKALDMTIEESPSARLFADIVGRQPDATPKEIVQPRAHVLPRTARWIIFAVLIIVVSLPIIIGEPLLPRTIEPTAATVDMYRAMESVDSLDPVLVAFDYDPTSSGELDVIAKALVGHLMDREARVVVVSMLPAGPATAEAMLDELAADRPGYAETYGERYANLGYLPGQAAAVRLVGLSIQSALPRDFYGTPLSELPVMRGLDSTQAFSLIVELAAAQDTLRWWIEQAGTPLSIPLGAGTSASVIPFARPYYETESRQLVGLVGGVPDAATYEALTSGQNSPTSSSAARLDSQLAGQLLFVLVILAGNVVYFSRRGSGRES